MMRCPLCDCQKVKRIIDQKTWEIWQCQICNNAWTAPPPSEISYDQVDFHAETVNNKQHERLTSIEDLPYEWRNSIRMQLQLLSRYLKPGAKILEIGCGEGLLAQELIKSGFQFQGIEPSIAAVKRAKEKGVNVVQGYFPNPEIQGEFDAIVMSHVLEHIADPLLTLKQVADICPQGKLLLIQTHYKGLVPTLGKHKWNWMPEQHYWHFTPQGLINLGLKLGPQIVFETVECQFSSLVHISKAKFVDYFTLLVPPLRDQFHLLLQVQKL
jgi:SAM-dependent methyltransferase